MLRFVVRRLLQVIPTLLLLSLLVFAWLRSLPGGPAAALPRRPRHPGADRRAQPRARAGPADLRAVRQVPRPGGHRRLRHLDQDRPTGARRDRPGAAGHHRAVRRRAADRGAARASRWATSPRSSVAARWTSSPIIGTLVGVAVPVFFLGYLLKAVFAVELRLVPAVRPAVGGHRRHQRHRVRRARRAPDPRVRRQPATRCCHLVLPAVTLATIPLAVIVRITRASVLDVLELGLRAHRQLQGPRPRASIRSRHVLRNALLPVSTTIGLQVGLLLGGAVLTEKVFNWGGIGTLLADAITEKDYPRLQALLLLGALVYVLVNLLVDLSYAVIDPRVRLSMTLTTWAQRRKDRIDDLAERRGSLTAEAFRRLRRDPVAITGAVIVGAVRGGRRAGPADRPARRRRRRSRSCRQELRPGIIPGPQDGLPAGQRPAGARLLLPDDPGLPADAAGRRARHADRARSSALVIGTLAGAFGGWVDTVLMRVHRRAAGDPEPAAGHLGGRAGRQRRRRPR